MIIEANNQQDFIVYEVRGGNTVEITNIAVNSERRAGIGTQLINTMIKHLKCEDPYNLYVMTRESNTVARDFYRAVGFQTVAILPEFYFVKKNIYENAIFFRKVIHP